MEKIIQQKVKELMEIVELFEEKERLENITLPETIENKKFGFLSKYLFNRKEYKKYMEEKYAKEEKIIIMQKSVEQEKKKYVK